VRGNKYSRDHVSLSPEEVHFWKFSFDEMGNYDVPAMVKYVLHESGHQKLDYVGHSQGAVVLLASVMTHGETFSDLISNFFAMAPAAYVSHMTSPLRHLVKFVRLMQLVKLALFSGEFLPSNLVTNYLPMYFCHDAASICDAITFQLFGHDMKHMNESRMPVYNSHDPSGTSVQNMVHWAQMMSQEEPGMTHFDYGTAVANRQHYHQREPPAYNFTDFTIPTYVFCGTTDALVTMGDCHALSTIIPSVKDVTDVDGYSHIDFIYGMNAPSAIYERITEVIARSGKV